MLRYQVEKTNKAKQKGQTIFHTYRPSRWRYVSRAIICHTKLEINHLSHSLSGENTVKHHAHAPIDRDTLSVIYQARVPKHIQHIMVTCIDCIDINIYTQYIHTVHHMKFLCQEPMMNTLTLPGSNLTCRRTFESHHLGGFQRSTGGTSSKTTTILQFPRVHFFRHHPSSLFFTIGISYPKLYSRLLLRDVTITNQRLQKIITWNKSLPV